MASVAMVGAGASYLQWMLVLGVLVGPTAGMGAIVFYEALLGATRLLRGILADYYVPTRTGEDGHVMRHPLFELPPASDAVVSPSSIIRCFGFFSGTTYRSAAAGALGRRRAQPGSPFEADASEPAHEGWTAMRAD
jgi:hypothetical protein